MLPIVTTEEMRAIDAEAPEDTSELIERAGAAVARAALEMLGGAYGRRVVVVAGKGNNGADGRAAAERLRRRGVRVEVREAGDARPLPRCDLVVDAAFGSGFSGTWTAPEIVEPTPVLAVDIPTGVDGDTGAIDDASTVWRADATVTFAALGAGLLLHPGRSMTGSVTLADIGLDVSRARAHLVEDPDVAGWLTPPPPTTHKWKRAVWVVAGSPGMEGAAALTCAGAQRCGAGYVRLSSPSVDDGRDCGPPAPDPRIPVEVVRTPLHGDGWWVGMSSELERFEALVIGNGLGREEHHVHDVRSVVASSTIPTVVDADGLRILGEGGAGLLGPRHVVTPHDGEFAALAGELPGPDRLGAVRNLAERLGCVVLLKGPTTVVGRPDGEVLVVDSGDARLATAGTGDVLAGMVGALCAQGLDPFLAAAAAAHLHGRAASLGHDRGLRAGDLPDLVPVAIARAVAPPSTHAAGVGRGS